MASSMIINFGFTDTYCVGGFEYGGSSGYVILVEEIFAANI